MSATESLSPENLRLLAETNFMLLAETWAELVKKAPDTKPARMGIRINGIKVTAVITAEEAGQ